MAFILTLMDTNCFSKMITERIEYKLIKIGNLNKTKTLPSKKVESRKIHEGIEYVKHTWTPDFFMLTWKLGASSSQHFLTMLSDTWHKNSVEDERRNQNSNNLAREWTHRTKKINSFVFLSSYHLDSSHVACQQGSARFMWRSSRMESNVLCNTEELKTIVIHCIHSFTLKS